MKRSSNILDTLTVRNISTIPTNLLNNFRLIKTIHCSCDRFIEILRSRTRVVFLLFYLSDAPKSIVITNLLPTRLDQGIDEFDSRYDSLYIAGAINNIETTVRTFFNQSLTRPKRTQNFPLDDSRREITIDCSYLLLKTDAKRRRTDGRTACRNSMIRDAATAAAASVQTEKLAGDCANTINRPREGFRAANSSRIFFHVASFQLHRRIPTGRSVRPAAFTNLSRLITR